MERPSNGSMTPFKDMYFVFSLKDGTSLIINNFEIPAVFACRLAGKKCGNFKMVDDKATSIL